MSTFKCEVVPVSLKPHPNADTLSLCACGCGGRLDLRDSRGRMRRFIHGHNAAFRRIALPGVCSVCDKPFDRDEIPARYPGDVRRGAVKGMCKPCYHLHRYNSRDGETVVKDRETRRKVNVRLRARVLAAFGNSCVCCGEDEDDFLTIDHIRGEGRLHREAVGVYGVYRAAEKAGPNSGEYRLLCFNCNIARGLRGACPHERIAGPLMDHSYFAGGKDERV